MALSDKTIFNQLEKGTIVIEPFTLENLSNSSYDVTLGEWFYREQSSRTDCFGGTVFSRSIFDGHKAPHLGNVFNPYSKSDVSRIWGTPQRAPTYEEWARSLGSYTGPMAHFQEMLDRGLEGIPKTAQVIWISPGESKSFGT